MFTETKYFTHPLPLTAFPNTILPARLAYRTYGDPTSPSILLPTCYGGTLSDTLPFLYTGPSCPFPTSQYHIILVGLLGGSESSSPSNSPAPYSSSAFPHTTYADNITLQHALCRSLGVEQLFAYIGFSMGGQQAYHLATLHPTFAERVVVICGSARTSSHNWAFLEGPKAALVNSEDFKGGRYTADAPARKGTAAFGRVYCPWALSRAWFAERCWEKCGYASLADYMREEWEVGLGSWDANDLLAKLWTWQDGDVGRFCEGGGGLEGALRGIQAKCLVMPCRTDTYFAVEDSEEEIKSLRHGTLAVIESIWGHMAGGGGGTDEDTKFIQDTIGKWIKE